TASRFAVRSFSVAGAAKKDMIQDLYLKEIRSYKPDPKAAKADVTTKEFVAPKVPEAPKNDVNLEADIKTYEQSGVINTA
ncbi:ATP synthase F0 subcomplex subunit H atp14, partial [Coemansia sp. RSA 1933]